MKVIVDTGVWSEFFRRSRAPRSPAAQELARLIRDDAVQMLGPIRQELLSGARPAEHFEKLREYLRYFPNLALNETHDELAADFYNTCRAKEIQGTGTNLIICAAAALHKMKIFSLDTDFTRYATALPIKVHQVRAGSGH